MNSKIHVIALVFLFSSFPLCNKSDAQLVGDLNADVACDLQDFPLLVNQIITGTYSIAADMNVDGIVDTNDLQPFIDLLTFGTADVNRDGNIDTLDVPVFVNILLTGPYDTLADMNRDSSVDPLDIAGFVTSLITGIPSHP